MVCHVPTQRGSLHGFGGVTVMVAEVFKVKWLRREGGQCVSVTACACGGGAMCGLFLDTIYFIYEMFFALFHI